MKSFVQGTKLSIVEQITKEYMECGVILTTSNSKTKPNGRVYITLECDRHHSYKPRPQQESQVTKKKKRTGTILNNCEFQIKVTTIDGYNWEYHIQRPHHNHPLSVGLEGHPIARRLDSNQQTLVTSLAASAIQPRHVVTALREADPLTMVDANTVYAFKTKVKKLELDGRLPTHALLDKLKQEGYQYNHMVDASGRLTHLFFAHRGSIAMIKTFSEIFLMDCTYKTNEYLIAKVDMGCLF